MKIKDRIRKAIFELFKPEIMEYTKPLATEFSKMVVNHKVPYAEMEYKKIDYEVELFDNYHGPERILREIEVGKLKMCDEILKLIKVDESQIFRQDRRRPSLHFYLWVGFKKEQPFDN